MTPSIKLSYHEAKAWAQSQSPKIAGVKGWKALKKAGGLPPGMPAWPQGAYKEFESWGEFLGTGTLAAMRRVFRPYEEAKAWVRGQVPAITTKAQWQDMVKRIGVPADIPTDPRSHYKEQFEGWGAFLGTGTIAPQRRIFLSYEELKIWIQEQSPVIYSREEYLRRVKASGRLDLPQNPERTYPGEYEGWPKLLGVRTLGSTSMIERMLKQELASFLPVDESSITRLVGGDGKSIQVDIYIPSMSLAIEYDGKRFHAGKEDKDKAKMANLCRGNPGLRFVRVRELPLEKLTDLDMLVAPSSDALGLTQDLVRHLLELKLIPEACVDEATKYLDRTTLAGKTIVGARWRSYEKAREWARAQGITKVVQWRRLSSVPGFLPSDIPTNPIQVYGSEFVSWSDFLGAPIVATQHKKFWPYERAQAWAKKKGLTKGRQWTALSAAGKLPKSLPSNPQATYKDQWRGWGEFLGTAKPKDQEWANLEEIAQWCAQQSPPLTSFKQWQVAKNMPDFPKHFPKSLHYHFGAGVYEKIRLSLVDEQTQPRS